MRCVTARRLLLDKRDARPRSRARESLSQHLRRCPECRRELAEIGLLGETLSDWADGEVSHEERRLVVDAMLAVAPEPAKQSGTPAPAARGPWPMRVGGLRLSYVLGAVLLLLVTWTGDRFWGNHPTYSWVTRALDNVPTWYAKGAIYPAIFPSSNKGINEIEVWFRKPHTVRANIDGDYIQFLQDGRERQLFFRPFNYLEIREADSPDLTRIFDVREWMQEQAVAGVVPARRVATMHREYQAPKILFELDISPVLFTETPEEPVLALVRVDRETMLPERVETSYLGRDFWLEFDYTGAFPLEALSLDLPEEGVTVGDEILREVDARLGQ